MKSLATTIFVCCSFLYQKMLPSSVLVLSFVQDTPRSFLFVWRSSFIDLKVCSSWQFSLCLFVGLGHIDWGWCVIGCFSDSMERGGVSSESHPLLLLERLGFQFFDSIAFPMFPSSFSKLFLMNHLCLRFVEKKNSKGDKSCRSCLSYFCSEFHIVIL